ncbi:hypothetical protein BKA61DRAFT_678648 [Leptodontidium sp. MPI-SDFR-AT-0119]|nr:hypothetical protein BKA61DRAFT_678648 [Leptodontidium sp. MPI-SDFR-AT-0119]
MSAELLVAQKTSSVGNVPNPTDAVQTLSTSFRPPTSSGTNVVIEPAAQPLCSSSRSDSSAAFSALGPMTHIEGPVISEPSDSLLVPIPERKSPTTYPGLGRHSTPSTTMDVVTTAMENLEVSSHVRECSVTNSDESETAQSWLSIEELDFEGPHLDINAREQVELTLETFWDVFNRRIEELYRQRPAVDQQVPAPNAPAHISGDTTSLPATSTFRSLKRRHSRFGNGDEDDGQPPKRGRSEPGLPSDTTEKLRYSCPYRKHNRQRYNIHTHRTCALSGFSSIARVKEHLYRTHRASIQCPRCSLQFRDQKALKTHLRSIAVCNYVAGQPVEGFELDVEEKLKRRRKTAADQTDAERWEEIYRLLFPGQSVPSPYFEPPRDEPPPPNTSIEDFILNEVPRLIRSRVEEYFSSTGNLALTRETLVESMPSLVKQAIDATILTFKTKGTEQRRAQDEIGSILSTGPTQATSSSRRPRRENQLNPMQESLWGPRPLSLQSAQDSRDSSTSRLDLSRQISLTSTVGSHSFAQEVNQSDVSECVMSDVNQTGGGRVAEGNRPGGIGSLITSHKGKEKATSPPNGGSDNQDFLADVDFPFESFPYLNGHLSLPDVFDHTLFDEDVDKIFEEYFHDSVN